MISKNITSNFFYLLRTKKEFFLLAGIVLLGLILRLINLGTEPYWSDELLSLTIAKHYLGNPVGLWHYLQIVEVHPPLYYYLIEIWGSLFNFNEAAIRSLSLIFSLGLIPLVYWAGLILFNSKKTGLLAAFITTILPLQIEFGQEARPYAIFCFFGFLSFIILNKYFEAQKNKTKILLLLGFILSSLIGLYLHYSYTLILVPLAIYWLIKIIINKKNQEFLWWLTTLALIFLGFSPWLPALLFKTFFINLITTEIARSSFYVRDFSFLENALNNLLWASKETPHILEILLTILVKIMFLGLIILIIKNKEAWLKQYKDNLIYLISILILSILLFLCLPSSANYITLVYKHLLFSSTIIALLIAAIFMHLDKIRWRSICLIFFIISLITFQVKIISDDSLYDLNARFKIMVEHINKNYQTGDLLLVGASSIRPQVNYYLGKNLPEFVAVMPADIMSNDFLATKETLGILENESQLRNNFEKSPSLNKKLNYIINKKQPKRIWILCANSDGILVQWFTKQNWRLAFKPINNLFPVALFINPATIK